MARRIKSVTLEESLISALEDLKPPKQSFSDFVNSLLKTSLSHNPEDSEQRRLSREINTLDERIAGLEREKKQKVVYLAHINKKGVKHD